MRTKHIHISKHLNKVKSQTKTKHRAYQYAVGSYISVTTSTALGSYSESITTEGVITPTSLGYFRNDYVVDIASFDARPDQSSLSLYIPPYEGIGWTRTITLDQEIVTLLAQAKFRSVTTVLGLLDECIAQSQPGYRPIVTRLWGISAREPLDDTLGTTIMTKGITFRIPYLP
jgi:hypothetical protein